MAILTALLEITVYSAALFGAILLLKKVLGKKMSPALHFGVWMLLVARLLLPVTIDGGFHFITLPAAEEAAEYVQPPQIFVEEAPVRAQQNTQQNTQPERQHTGPLTARMGARGEGLDVQTRAEPGLPKITPEQGLLLLWLAGVGVSAAVLLYGGWKMRRTLRLCAADTPQELHELLVRCKRELNIRADIRIHVQHGIASPALLFPRTIVIPAQSLLKLRNRQMRLVLLHELLHYKRRDHIVALLLHLLRAVYWFNPVVWLAFPQVRGDMETACDNDVVRTVGIEGRDAYAQTVLSLFARGTAPAVLGMALTDTRKTAEQRIRGIYMKSNTRRSVKVVSVIVACVLCVACFTTACVPVAEQPEAPAVVQEDAQTIAEEEIQPPVAAAGEESGSLVPMEIKEIYAAPEKWVEELDGKGGAKIHINADIHVPDLERYPIATTADLPMTQEFADKMRELLTGDRPLYAMPEEVEEQGDSYYESRQWIDYEGLTELADTQFSFRPLEHTGSYVYGEEKSMYGTPVFGDPMQGFPTDHVWDAAAIERARQSGLGDIIGFTKEGDGKYMELQIHKSADVVRSQDAAGNSYIRYTFAPAVTQGYTPVTTVPLEESIRKADALLQQIKDAFPGLEIGFHLEDAAEYDQSDSGHSADGSDVIHSLWYGSALNGLPKYDLQPQVGLAGQQGVEHLYSLPVWQEMVYIVMDDSGILDFYWRAPGSVISETLPNDPQGWLLDFDTVKGKIARELQNRDLWYEAGGKVNAERKGITECWMDVEDIYLSYMPVMSSNGYMLDYIPVWDVCAKYYYRYAEGKGEELLYKDENGVWEIDPFTPPWWDSLPVDYSSSGAYAYSFLTIDAITGETVRRPLY